jgi:hypothetical protein
VRHASLIIGAFAGMLFVLGGCATSAPAPAKVTVTAHVIRDLPESYSWRFPGILKDGDLVLPHTRDGFPGIGFFDVASAGRQEDRLKQLRVQGEYYEPGLVGYGNSTWWIRTTDRNWLVLDADFGLRRKVGGLYTVAVPAPVVLGDRAFVYGFAQPEACHSAYAYFFELDTDGGCVPLLEFSQEEDHLNLGFQWIGAAGGLGRSPSGGFAFVDPFEYRVMVFDGKGRLEVVFDGVNERWARPDWSSAPAEWGERNSEFWGWIVSQTRPKSPVFLDENHLAVLVGFGAADGASQSFELDVYRRDGTLVATGVPVPEINGVGRVHVAQRTQPNAGDSIIAWVEAEFPPPFGDVTKPTQVWAIDVEIE